MCAGMMSLYFTKFIKAQLTSSDLLIQTNALSGRMDAVQVGGGNVTSKSLIQYRKVQKSFAFDLMTTFPGRCSRKLGSCTINCYSTLPYPALSNHLSLSRFALLYVSVDHDSILANLSVDRNMIPC